MNKLLRLSLIALSSFTFVSCNTATNSSNVSTNDSTQETSTNGSTQESSTNQEVKAPKLLNSYLSPAQIEYVNMRPDFNYYLTTFVYQNLEVYEDETYCFTISSSTFSALVLPEEGNKANGNERDNSLVHYYGVYKKEVDTLDEDIVYYTLSEPSRIVSSNDTSLFVDTDNWNAEMKKNSVDKQTEYDPETQSQKVVGTKEYETGEEYLEAKKFKAIKLTATEQTCSLEFEKNLFNKDRVAEANAPATKKTNILPSLKTTYLSNASLSYSNFRPANNYYLTTFAFANLSILDDSNYCLTLSSSTFSALVIPKEGNDANGNERDNSLVKYYGTFTAKVNDLDEDSVDYTLSEPNRIVGIMDAKGFVDTANWTEKMKKMSVDQKVEYNPETGAQTVTGKTEYGTGSEYLNAKKFEAITLTTSIKYHTLDYKDVFNVRK